MQKICFIQLKKHLFKKSPCLNRLSKNMFPLAVESAHWMVASALRCANLRSQVVFVLILSPDRCPLLMFGLHSSLVYILQSTNRSTEIPIKTKVVDLTVSQKNKKEDVKDTEFTRFVSKACHKSSFLFKYLSAGHKQTFTQIAPNESQTKQPMVVLLAGKTKQYKQRARSVLGAVAILKHVVVISLIRNDLSCLPCIDARMGRC